jgi:hypothetical protein
MTHHPHGYRTLFKTINMQTGEIIDGVPVYVAPTKVHWKVGMVHGIPRSVYCPGEG